VLGERYKVVRLIGEGGMGAVYEGEHAHMHKRLAIKVLHPEMSRLPEVVARFEREAMAASHIDHPNVAGATDFGKLDDGSFFLILEFVEGTSLRDRISQGRIDVKPALHIARQIAAALGRAHGLGIVHRDLKPENVMLVERDGDRDFVKVLDFGIAKVPVGEIAPQSTAAGKSALTQLGMVYGTPEYMAPEQALGQEVDARADLYALGVILFEMLSGKRPFENESKVTLLGMHVTAPVPKITDKAPGVVVPGEVEAIIQRLMEKEAKKRFATARELIEALERALGMSPLPGSSPALPVTPASVPSLAVRVDTMLTKAERSLAGPLEKIPLKTTKRNKLFAAAGGVVLALLLVVGLFIGVGKLFSGSGGKTATGTDGEAPKKTSDNPFSMLLPDTGPESKIAALAAKVDKGEAKDAIPELEALAAKYPERPDVHRALAHAYLATNDTQKMIAEAGKWGALDEKAAGADDTIVGAVQDAALDRDSADAAFPVLELKLGEAGADSLYEIAYGTAGKKEQLSQIRARKSLTAADVKKHFSPALAVTLDIKMSTNICDTKKDAFPEAKRVGDQRTLDVLLPFTRTRGCGFLNTGDCFPCIRGGDDSLDKTMAAIRARIKKP
jgi:serine/threonine-protein kinase